MAELVTDCPRCGAVKVTLDVQADKFVFAKHDWMRFHEAFCVCRNCRRACLLLLRQTEYEATQFLTDNGMAAWKNSSLNRVVEVERVITIADLHAVPAPDHLPDDIRTAFEEGAKCLAVGCFNAAGTMFRMCVDLATRPLLPAEDSLDNPNSKVRRDLGLRLPWLFQKGRLPEPLHPLASCIREDGNDGAHVHRACEAETRWGSADGTARPARFGIGTPGSQVAVWKPA